MLGGVSQHKTANETSRGHKDTKKEREREGDGNTERCRAKGPLLAGLAVWQ